VFESGDNVVWSRMRWWSLSDIQVVKEEEFGAAGRGAFIYSWVELVQWVLRAAIDPELPFSVVRELWR
jgi:hypothetical protein